MTRVSVQEVRSNLKALLDRVAQGEEVVIVRRGKEVARLVPPERQGKHFPDLSEFRASIKLRGEPLNETVIRERREARY